MIIHEFGEGVGNFLLVRVRLYVSMRATRCRYVN